MSGDGFLPLVWFGFCFFWLFLKVNSTFSRWRFPFTVAFQKHVLQFWGWFSRSRFQLCSAVTHDCNRQLFMMTAMRYTCMDLYVILFKAGGGNHIPHSHSSYLHRCYRSLKAVPGLTSLSTPWTGSLPDGVKAKDLDLGSAHYGLWAKPSLLLVFVQPTKLWFSHLMVRGEKSKE